MGRSPLRRRFASSIDELFSYRNLHVLISTAEKAAGRDAVIAGIVDMQGKGRTVGLVSFKTIRRAQQTNLLEKVEPPLPVQDGRVRLKLGHDSIDTFQFK